MKKRIIASTMASVMALGTATSLVASAETLKYEQLPVDKAGLEKFLDSAEIQEYLDGKLEDYGSNAAKRFELAIDYAEGLLEDYEDGNATKDDYTTAYLMIKAAIGELHQWTLDDLAHLLADCEADYMTQNKLNSEGDEVFKGALSLWNAFKNAYEDAEELVEDKSDDLLEITDVYDELLAAHNALSRKETVDKARMEKAIAEYEKLTKLEFKYQPWERAKLANTGDSNYDGKVFAWGTLYAHIRSLKDDFTAQYKIFAGYEGGDVLSSNDAIVAAVKNMEKAVKIINGFSNELDNKKRKSNVEDLLGEYHSQMVYTYNSDAAATVLADFIAKNGGDEGDVEFLLNTGVWKAGDELRDSSDSLVDMSDVTVADPADYWNRLVSTVATGSKTLEAKLEVRSTDDVGMADNLYFVLKDNKLPNGKNEIDVNAGTAFYTSITTASNRATAIGVPTTNVVTIRRHKDSIDIAQYLPVTYSMVLAANTGDVSLDSAVTTPIMTALTTFSGKVAAFKAITADALTTASGLTTGSGNGEVDADKKTALVNAITALDSAVADVQTNIAAITSAADLSEETIKDVDDAYKLIAGKFTALEAALGVISHDATGSAADTITDTAYAKINVTTSTTEYTDLVAAYNDESGDPATGFVTDVKGAYNEAVDAAGGAALAEAANAIYENNGVYDNGVGGSFTFTGIMKNLQTNADYTSSRTDGTQSDVTTASLPRAMRMWEAFCTNNWTSIDDIDNRLVFKEDQDKTDNVKGDAWKLLYNYMKYALEDMFVANAGTTYTLKDVKDLIDKADKLSKETQYIDVLNASKKALVQDRQGAWDWVKLAEADDTKNKTVRYKDNVSSYTVVTSNTTPTKFDSTGMYNQLKTSYDKLNTEYKNLKYSYGDIIKDMTSIAKRLNANEFSGSTKTKLEKALNDAALALLDMPTASNVAAGTDSVAQFSTAMFNTDDTWNRANRLATKTSTGTFPVATEYDATGSANKENTVTATSQSVNMLKKYEALTAALKAAEDANKTPVSEIVEDLNGNGSLDIGDVQAALKLYVDGKMEVAKHDYNGDKAVNIADVTALLTKWAAAK